MFVKFNRNKLFFTNRLILLKRYGRSKSYPIKSEENKSNNSVQ